MKAFEETLVVGDRIRDAFDLGQSGVIQEVTGGGNAYRILWEDATESTRPRNRLERVNIDGSDPNETRTI